MARKTKKERPCSNESLTHTTNNNHFLTLSIIVPTLNEGEYLTDLLSFLSSNPAKDQYEVLVVDGGSSDNTVEIAEQFNVKLLVSDKSCRATQMNLGAKNAVGETLYFVHADIGLVPSFVSDIKLALRQGYLSGCYSGKFVGPAHPLLKVNAWFTKFSFSWCRGGDQTLFITKEHFDELGGYNEDFVIMEDYELLDKLLQKKSFKVIKKDISISARKYKYNSYLKVQLVNLKAMNMYKRGESTQKIKDYYRNALSTSARD